MKLRKVEGNPFEGVKLRKVEGNPFDRVPTPDAGAPEPKIFFPPFDDPRARATGGDSLLLGYGNELVAGLGAAKDYLMSSGDDGAPASFKDSYSRRIGAFEDQKASLREDNPELANRMTLGGALVGGGKAAGLLNPKGWAKRAALGTLMGGGEARGLSAPGNEKGAGELGALFGAGGALTGAVIDPLTRSIPQLGKTVKRLVKEDAPLSPTAARAEAEGIFGDLQKRSRKSPADLSTKVDELGPEAVVADVIGDEGSTALGQVSRLSQEARDAVEGSTLFERTKQAGTRTRKDLGTSTEAADVAMMNRTQLGAIENNIGKDMDTFLVKNGEVPLNNQDELLDFLREKPEIMKAARKAYNRKYKKDIQFNEDNTEIIDHKLEKIIRTEFDQKITMTKDPLAKNTPKTATATAEATDWAEMADRSSSPEIKELRLNYSAAAKNTRAYNEGTKFSSMSESDLKRWLDRKTPAEIAAFKNGAVEDLANKGEGVMTSLTSDTQRGKLRSVFGEEADDMIKTVERERRFATTADVQAAGAKTGLDEDILGDITGNKLRDFELGGSLRGKRAYSEKGGMWMLVNEIINNYNNIKVPREVQVELAKILTTADDIPGFLAKIEKSNLSRKYAKDLYEMTKKVEKSQNTAAGGVLGGLMSQGGNGQ